MEVNEKCDVYSFGVVALEVVMGKHPGDLFSSLISGSSSSSTTSSSHHLPIGDVLDQRISPPAHELAGEVLCLMKTAIACLNANPPSRPTMKQVSQQLLTKRLQLSKPLPVITCGELISLNHLTI